MKRIGILHWAFVSALILGLPLAVFSKPLPYSLTTLHWSQKIVRQVPTHINVDCFPKKDPDYARHDRIMSSKPNPQDKFEEITVFKDGKQGWYYIDDQKPEILYSRDDGTAAQVDLPVQNHPNAKATYCLYAQCTAGELFKVTIDTIQNDSLIFDSQGKLLNYWHQEQCYKPNGELCNLERKTIEE